MNPKTYLDWVGKKPALWCIQDKFKVGAKGTDNGLKWIVVDKNGNGALVGFKKPHSSLTIFEAELLYCAFLRRKQRDYARYDKCGAGKEFFAGIDKLYVIRDKIVHDKETIEVK